MESKKVLIENMTNYLIEESIKSMKNKVKRAVNCGFFDIEKWDINVNPMIIPKTIITAVLKDEAEMYNAKGTSFEKEIKVESNKLINFL